MAKALAWKSPIIITEHVPAGGVKPGAGVYCGGLNPGQFHVIARGFKARRIPFYVIPLLTGGNGQKLCLRFDGRLFKWPFSMRKYCFSW